MMERSSRKGASRKTGPSQGTRATVIRRDAGRCVRCGRMLGTTPFSIQHRKARGMGGTSDPQINSPANLILLCGDGVTGCHGWVESHREAAREGGWGIHSWDDPTEVPVQYLDGVYYLDADGNRAQR